MANSGHAFQQAKVVILATAGSAGVLLVHLFQQPHTGRAQSVHTIIQAAARLAAYASRNARALQQAMKTAPGQALNLAQD